MAPRTKKQADPNAVVFVAPEDVAALGIAGHNYEVVDGKIEVPSDFAAEHITDLVLSGFTPAENASELYARANEIQSFEQQAAEAEAVAAAQAEANKQGDPDAEPADEPPADAEQDAGE